MAQTPQQLRAKRLRKTLRLPKQLSKVVHDPKYWFEEFVDLFLEECDRTIFEQPREGLVMVQVAPQLVQRISAISQDRQRVLQVRALALLGTAYRNVHNLSAANAAYEEALAIVGIPVLERAHVLRRLALLRVEEKHFGEALQLANKVLAIYEDLSEKAFYAHGLNVRGVLNIERQDYESALCDFTEGLRYVHPRRSPRTYYVLLHNTAHALSYSCADIDTIDAALTNIRSAARFGKIRRKSVPRFKLRWIQGIMLVQLGSLGLAETEFKTARQGLIELGVPYSMALVSLELGALYHQEGRWEELQKLAAETYAIFNKAQRADAESLAALTLWIESTKEKTITDAITAQIREVLETRSRLSLIQRVK